MPSSDRRKSKGFHPEVGCWHCAHPLLGLDLTDKQGKASGVNRAGIGSSAEANMCLPMAARLSTHLVQVPGQMRQLKASRSQTQGTILSCARTASLAGLHRV